MQPSAAGDAPELLRVSTRGVEVFELGLRGDLSGEPLVLMCGAMALCAAGGRPLGPRQGTLLARTNDLAQAQAFGASAQAALERWQRGEAPTPDAAPALR